MRSLVILFSILFFCGKSFGSYTTAGLSFQSSQNVSYYQDTKTVEANTNTTSLTYGLFELNQHSNVTLGFDRIKVPYDVLVVKRKNEETGAVELIPFDQLYSNSTESWLSLGYEYAQGPWTISTSGRAPIVKVPYDSRTGGVTLRYQVADLTTLIGGTEHQRSKRPESYTTDSNQFEYALPTKVYLRKYNLGVEQIISSKMKASLILETAKASGERPRNFGYNGSFAVAVTDELFVKGGYVLRDEISSRVVNTVGGHLSYQSTFLEGTWEPVYDLHLSLSYQLAVEKANEENGRESQLAFDEYGLGASYQWNSSLKTVLKGSFVDSNAFKEQINFEGGIEWTL